MAKQSEEKAMRMGRLVIKKLNGELTEMEAIELEQWLSASEEYQQVHDEMMDGQMREKTLGDESPRDSLAVQEEVWRRHQANRPRSFNRPRWRTRVACALIAATLLMALAYTKQATILNWLNPVEQVRIATEKGERQEVSLPDGTKVWLNAASRLTYPSRFDSGERKVMLSGEAFFDVTARASQPFSIRTDNLQVTVLGTRFNLKAYENESASSISMASGKVNIDVNGSHESGGKVIAAGEQGVLNKSTGQFATTKIDTAWVGKWRSDELFIDGQSLKEVFGMLERQYNVSIEVHNNKILSESVTLNLQEPTLEEVLDMLSYTTNFTYEFKNDSTIYIR